MMEYSSTNKGLLVSIWKSKFYNQLLVKDYEKYSSSDSNIPSADELW